MRRRLRTISLVLVIGMVSAACGAAATSTGPPEINLGRDICIECGMIIDDPRFAASYRLEDGTEKVFDDLGGLIIHGREAGELETASVWVSDFEEKVFVEAETAHFVPTLGVASPMGHGILAFSNMDRAMKAAADLDGEVIDWATVRELPAMDGLVGHHHMDMDGGEEHDMEDHEEDHDAEHESDDG
ncbi:MAG: nitrous oxide reductase accessory protein NosL [Actinomycetota bacterium]|nr:nitrous oxide reductase accessory protein NosL [Actinomycetota bacterium]